jgi:hypothetical protein
MSGGSAESIPSSDGARHVPIAGARFVDEAHQRPSDWNAHC